MNHSSNSSKDAAVLIVAFHFPPQAGSSGQLRALKFCRYLPEFGWRPSVLTLKPRAYETVDPEGEKTVQTGLPVYRAFGLDTKRHLGFRGLYWDALALPDRWVSWLLGAVPKGLYAIHKERVDVILATFPIASAVLVGFVLHKLSGKPWVVDFRDSMTEEGYPREARTRRVWRWLERKVIRSASRVIFTAASTRAMYLARYPALSAEKCLIISNGYDEADFTNLPADQAEAPCASSSLRLLHTGLLYPEERDPRPFFRALARLKSEGRLSCDQVTFSFRAPGSEDLYRTLLQENGISDLVSLQAHVPYSQALRECAAADGLMLFQAANCDHQIPAKAYEYLRLRRPIFALTTQTGDTAALLNEVGGASIVDLASEEAIYRGLPLFMEAVRRGTHPLPDQEKIRRYARRNQAHQLAQSLSEIRSGSPEPVAGKRESFAR